MVDVAVIGLAWAAKQCFEFAIKAPDGVVGNVADRVVGAIVRAGRDRLGGIRAPDENHEIAKALRLAQMQALERVLREFQAEWQQPGLAAHEDFGVFFARAKDFCAKTIGRCLNPKVKLNVDLSPALLGAIEAEEGGRDDVPITERQDKLRVVAEDAVLDELQGAVRGTANENAGVGVPEPFKAHFRFGADTGAKLAWIELFGGYVTEQLKTNPRFHHVYIVDVLLQLKELQLGHEQSIEGLEKRWVERFEPALRAIHEGITELRNENRSQHAETQRQIGCILAMLDGGGRVDEGATPVPVSPRSRFKKILEEHRLFAGREESERAINAFFAGGGDYLFVQGDSGYGKTALLARLVNGDPDRYQFHFFSRTHVSTGEEEFQLNLAQQLLALHGIDARKLPRPGCELRAVCIELLQLPAPTGRSVNIVIDALDEADFRLNPYFVKLGAGVHILFSARPVANCNWLDELGLRDLPLTVLPPLGGLTPEDFSKLFVQAGGDAAQAASDPQTLADLEAVTAGDPFFVRALIEDFRTDVTHARNELRQLADEARRHTSPPLPHEGLWTYLARWWKEIEDKVGEAATVSSLLGYLAVARGPLKRDELIRISPDDALRGATINIALKSVERFLTGDASTGYRLCHPRFQQFVADRLSDEIPIFRDALLVYCGRWQANLNTHRGAYALRFYAGHLRELGKRDDLYELARDAGFLHAQTKAFVDLPNLPFETLDHAFQAALEADEPGRIAELLLRRADFGERLLSQDSPLEILRSTQQLTDPIAQRAIGRLASYEGPTQVLWTLLTAAELQDRGRLNDARAMLTRLLQTIPSRLRGNQARYGGILLAQSLPLDRNLFLGLRDSLLEAKDREPMDELLARRHSDPLVYRSAEEVEEKRKSSERVNEWLRKHVGEAAALRRSQSAKARKSESAVDEDRLRENVGTLPEEVLGPARRVVGLADAVVATTRTGDTEKTQEEIVAVRAALDEMAASAQALQPPSQERGDTAQKRWDTMHGWMAYIHAYAALSFWCAGAGDEAAIAVSEALAEASAIQWVKPRALALADVARFEAQMGMTESSRALFRQACDAAQTELYEVFWSYTLVKIATSQEEAGDGAGARETISRSLAVVTPEKDRAAQDAWFDTLTSLVRVLAKAGERSKALELVAKSRGIADALPNEYKREEALRQLVVTLADIDEYESATALNQTLPPEGWLQDAAVALVENRARFAITAARAGDQAGKHQAFAEAERLACTIRNDTGARRVTAAQRAVVIVTEAGDRALAQDALALAKEAINQIVEDTGDREERMKIVTLTDLARLTAQAGWIEETDNLLADAETLLDRLSEEDRYDNRRVARWAISMARVARTRVRLRHENDPSQARSTLLDVRKKSLAQVVTRTVEEVDRCDQVLSEIVAALCELAAVRSRAGESSEAAAILREAADTAAQTSGIEERIAALIELAAAHTAIGEREAARGALEQAFAIISRFESPDSVLQVAQGLKRLGLTGDESWKRNLVEVVQRKANNPYSDRPKYLTMLAYALAALNDKAAFKALLPLGAREMPLACRLCVPLAELYLSSASAIADGFLAGYFISVPNGITEIAETKLP